MRIIVYTDGVFSSTKEINIEKKPKKKGMSFQPSAAAYWLECAGYALIDDGGMTSPAAIKGTILHKEAEEDLYQVLVEGKEANLQYSNYVKSRIPSKGTVLIGIEVFFQHSKIHNFRGFVDCLIVKEETKEIEIIDYKTGARLVPAKTNTQLGCYLNLLSNSHTQITKTKADLSKWKIIFTIHQLGFADTWEVSKAWAKVFVDTIDKHLKKYKNVRELSDSLFNGTLLNFRASCPSCFRYKFCPAAKEEVEEQVIEADAFVDTKKSSLSTMPEKDFVALWQKAKKIEKFVKAISDILKLRYAEGNMTLVEQTVFRNTVDWKKDMVPQLLKDSRFASMMLISAAKGKKLMEEDEQDLFLDKKVTYTIKLKKEEKNGKS